MTATVLTHPTATGAHAALTRLEAGDMHADDAATIRAALRHLDALPHPAARELLRQAILTLAAVRRDCYTQAFDYAQVRKALVADADLWGRICVASDAVRAADDDLEDFADRYCDYRREAVAVREEWETQLHVLLARAVVGRAS